MRVRTSIENLELGFFSALKLKEGRFLDESAISVPEGLQLDLSVNLNSHTHTTFPHLLTPLKLASLLDLPLLLLLLVLLLLQPLSAGLFSIHVLDDYPATWHAGARNMTRWSFATPRTVLKIRCFDKPSYAKWFWGPIRDFSLPRMEHRVQGRVLGGWRQFMSRKCSGPG